MSAGLILVLALQAATPGPAAPAPSSPLAPAPSAPLAPGAAATAAETAPRAIDDKTRPLTGAVPQGSYEMGVRGAFDRTQVRQGPLDGTWVLADAAGTPLYRVQLVDPAGGGELEGAWSDLRTPASTDATGFFTAASRDGPRLTLQLSRRGGLVLQLALEAKADGRYGGELSSSGTGPPQRYAVTLARP